MQRRQFLSAMVGGMTVLGTTPVRSSVANSLRAGEGVVEITPPLGIELAGFHKPPGQERRVKGIRQPAEVRALVLSYNATHVVVCSLDILGTSQEMARRIQRAAAKRTGIPSRNIHVVDTHDHSMPSFQKLRQWGGMSPEFMATVEKCKSGHWVDAGFAADWFRGNEHRDRSVKHLPITLGAIQLGPVGMLFHPGELYSYYGLAMRRDSPLRDTLVVGCANGCIGYLPDPHAYERGEYSATVVPKIIDTPPFQPTAARDMTAAAISLLKQTVDDKRRSKDISLLQETS